MKRVITEPQRSDMGEGFGYIEGAVGITPRYNADGSLFVNK